MKYSEEPLLDKAIFKTCMLEGWFDNLWAALWAAWKVICGNVACIILIIPNNKFYKSEESR